jgi:tripartite-type tricarboxylate transporter receptor subunit TctC
MIVPFPPGQATDIVARMLAQELSETWKQQVMVENISGGASVAGTLAGRNAAPDGYTLTFGTSSTLAVNPSTIPDLAYDPARDFVMVNAAFISPWVVVVHPSSPFNSLKDMIAAAKQKPHALTWGLGAASLIMGAELFKMKAGIDIVNVPYRGSGRAVSDLIGNQVPMLIDTVAATLPHIKEGKIKALASLSASRTPWLPDLPTAVELGYPGLEAAGWGGLVAPTGTPAAIVDKIGADVRRALERPDMKERLLKMGAIVDARGPAEWTEFVKAELAKWSDVARKANLATK